MNSPIAHLAVIASVTVGSLFAVPYFMVAGSPVGPRRAEYKEMTKQQKEQVEFNFGRFRRLQKDDPEKLKQIRSTHESLKSKPELIESAIRYRKWLTTVPSWKQQEIGELTDPDERFQYVRRLLAKDVIRFEVEASRMNSAMWKLGQLDEIFPVGIEVSIDDAENMANHFRSEVTRLEWLGRSKRPGEVAPRPSDAAYEERMEEFHNIVFDTFDLVSDGRLRDEFSVLRYHDDARMTRFVSFRILKELLRNYEDLVSPDPTDEQKLTIFKELPDAERARLRQMEPEKMDRELFHLFRGQQNAKSTEADKRYQRILSPTYSRFSRNGGRREGGRRDDRPPREGEDRPPGRRGQDRGEFGPPPKKGDRIDG